MAFFEENNCNNGVGIIKLIFKMEGGSLQGSKVIRQNAVHRYTIYKTTNKFNSFLDLNYSLDTTCLKPANQ